MRRSARTRAVGRAILTVLIGVLLTWLAIGAIAAVLQGRTERVLGVVHLEGTPVGGMTYGQLQDLATDVAERRATAAVHVRGVRRTAEASRAELGVTYDPEAAVDRAWSYGRRDPLRTPYDHLRALLERPIRERLPERIDEEELAAWARDTADQLSVEARAADVEFDDAPTPPRPDDPASRAQPVEPAPGEEVDADELLQELARTLGSTRGRVDLEAPSRTVQPAADQRDLDAILPDARQAVSAPVHLDNPADAADLGLTPRELAAVLEVRLHAERAPGSRLALAADPALLEETIGRQRIQALEAEPVEARFVIEAGRPRIEGGTPGYRFEAQSVASHLPTVATRDRRVSTLPGELIQPDLTRREAEELGVEEEVSSFTTSYSCCPPRVTNIHRGADIIDGTLVRPGERFSLDEALGPRTRARGFVDAGVIIDGEFEEDLGGGLSQLATTVFNAAFFSGLDIIEHQPHSYYFPRYPMGRESTIARGVIDVVFDNDSPYGILVDTSYTSTSVTVTFYSSPWAEVEAWTSEPFDRVEGEVRDGFSVRYGRTVIYPDGSTHEDAWLHRYQPQDE